MTATKLDLTFGTIFAGAVLVVLGIGELQRGQAMTPLPRPRDDGRLVESGVYRLVRHPIYGGLIVGAVGAYGGGLGG